MKQERREERKREERGGRCCFDFSGFLFGLSLAVSEQRALVLVSVVLSERDLCIYYHLPGNGCKRC